MLVVNPAARAVRPETAAAVAALWRGVTTVDVVSTTTGAAGLVLDERIAADGVDAVVVLSGDGLVNHVANLMVARGSGAVLVPLPGGSTNVLARSIGLGREPLVASATAIAALAGGRTQRIGWGTIDGRGFLINAGIGFDAAVVQRVEHDPDRKRRWGVGWFAAAGLLELARRAGRVDRAEVVTLPDGSLAWWVVALTRHPYTYAGVRRVELLPADLPMGDGLWVLSFGWPAARALSASAVRAMATKRGVLNSPGVRVHRVVTSMRLQAGQWLKAQVDGEPICVPSHAVLAWEPDVLTVPEPVPRHRPPTRRSVLHAPRIG